MRLRGGESAPSTRTLTCTLPPTLPESNSDLQRASREATERETAAARAEAVRVEGLQQQVTTLQRMLDETRSSKKEVAQEASSTEERVRRVEREVRCPPTHTETSRRRCRPTDSHPAAVHPQRDDAVRRMDEARAAENEAQGRLQACEEQLASTQRDMHRMKSSTGSNDTKVRGPMSHGWGEGACLTARWRVQVLKLEEKLRQVRREAKAARLEVQ